jgi:hypothetical protein
MKEFLELIKKYGATAVLVAWLFHTNMRVASLEAKLYKCLEAEKYEEQVKRLSECILPEQIKLKDETKSS